MNSKSNNIEFIKKFSKINTKSICENKYINSPNVYSGHAKNEDLEIIIGEIIDQSVKLFQEYYESVQRKETTTM